jgi:hypothetical protein
MFNYSYYFINLTGNQSRLERFLKRKIPPTTGNDDPEGGTSRRECNASNTNRPIYSSRISQHEVNFDELPYDPADRRRISDYIGSNLQDDIRRKYLTRGPCRPDDCCFKSQEFFRGFQS